MMNAIIKIQRAHFSGLFCLMLLFLVGCERPAILGGRYPAPEDLPTFSIADSVKSVDLDDNRIRVHVAALINSEVEALDKRKAWIDYARAIESSFLVDAFLDGQESHQAQLQYVSALACVHESTPDNEFRSSLLTRIHLLTIDSSLRKDLWQSFQSVVLMGSIKPKSNPCFE